MTHKVCRAPRRVSACTRSRQPQKPLLSFALLPASTLTSHAFALGSLRVGPGRVARTLPKVLKFGYPILPFLKGGDLDVRRKPRWNAPA
jgi:hypothetical protein